MTELLKFAVNGRRINAHVAPNRILAEFLREELRLTGCRIACDAAMCGACTVLVDGAPTTGCTTFVFEVADRAVETVEGLALADGTLHPVQQAFLDADAFQCGFCSAGLMLSVKAHLAGDPHPDDATIKSWLDAHLCRCTGYRSIIDAVHLAAAALRGS